MFTFRPTHQSPSHSMIRRSGSIAFDAYRNDTLRRLLGDRTSEQASFENFLERLRQAKSKAESGPLAEGCAKKDRAQKDRTKAVQNGCDANES